MSTKVTADPLGDSDSAALFGHFPELHDQVTGWDEAISRVHAISQAQQDRADQAALEAQLVPPAFYGATKVVATLITATRARADTGTLSAPFFMDQAWFQWRYPNGDLEPALRFGEVNNYVVNLAEPGALTASEYRLRVELLMADMQTWPETLAYANRDVDSGWGELKQPLLDSLTHLQERHNYKVGDGCPRCN